MLRHWFTTLAVIVPFAVPLLGAGQTSELTAPELAQALQRKYDSIKDFSADFVHTYQGGVLKRRLTERGRVVIKKPGRMRWDYTEPERKLFVSDGKRVYFYIPADKQVVVSPVPTDAEATTPALFLMGKGRLTSDFTPSLVDLPAGMPAGSLALKLLPKSRQQDYDWLVLAVDPTSFVIRGLMTVDGQGGTSTFAFTNMKENVGPADNQFEFTIPRGVDIVENPSRP
jgi:outer membrane lipoprotein carrier protein